METKRIYKTLKDAAITAGIIYAFAGSTAYRYLKTGHQSADLALGRSTPTFLEKSLLSAVGINPQDILIKEARK
jgi:hypothetical protein